ncbi:ABC transporter substrate-binding protein [Paraburkholderia azotifigens]|uniref:ABC transporter substrate-binding protein n=1 Tax=Paraburkholderia azotifigens TaxID=2057004 RepID=A0A5C6VG81_9BURK|nr:ABC transporter substrate-binding protein [Paraburkholderia azotifigens]TXC82815.1 ABC transporter substrate-binding protein [Paraburkholderia azotifigens]
MKKTLVCLALLCAALSSHARELTELRFGVDPTYAPFESKAPDGKLVGFEIDLGNEICRRLHTKCVWVETAFDGIIPALQGRKFDAILSAMSVTPKRETQVAFSTPLFNTPSSLIGRTGAAILPAVDSLKGKNIGVAQGSTQEAYAKAYWAPAGVNVVSYGNQELVYTDLRAGRLDATLTDMISGSEGFLKTPQGKGYGFLGSPVNDPKTLGKGAAIGLRKDDAELRTLINQAIGEMIKDGTYQKIERRYFDFDVLNG